MVFAVAFMCLSAPFDIQHENHRGYLVMGAVGVASYLMNTGFSSLNMQIASGNIEPRITPHDLTVENFRDTAQSLNAHDFYTTLSNASYRENAPNNSVLNTILRSLFITREDVPAWCNQSQDYAAPYKKVIANYGFPSRSWQQRALFQSLEPTASMSMRMSASDEDLPSEKSMPMSVSIATNLAVYAMVVKCFNLTKRSSTSATFISDVHDATVNYYANAENASTTDELATIEYSHVDLSDSVVFDALKIEIPTQMIGKQDNHSSHNLFYESLTNFLQALAICLNDAGGEELVVNYNSYLSNEVLQSCKQRSNTSIFIVSVGKRIEGDAFMDTPEFGYAGRIVNARTVYSLTVGRLSWIFENLAEVYNATCAVKNGCGGIRFPLKQAEQAGTSDVLLVSDYSIPMDLLSPINMNVAWFPVSSSQWKILASTLEETRGGDFYSMSATEPIVVPRNFKMINSTLTMHMKTSTMCDIMIEKYFNNIEKNHLYIEHTLQPAYTSGLYFILQNAVVLKELPKANTDAPTKLILDFSGNVQEMHIRASVSATNVLLACFGCVLMVCGGIVICTAKLDQRGGPAQRTVSTATEAISNPNKYPPFMLRLQLRDAATDDLVEISLDSLSIKTVVLANPADKTQQFVVTGSSISRLGFNQLRSHQTDTADSDSSSDRFRKEVL
ncbi:unnamed protein product [Phytophthora lilii]|uniref:Unnamed protein product n=1 Tax=Phytophthora lilii TaxID=2077276 RepID=A0A9W6WQJ1_9STRA|nr:unnamed protein product [Phytophthora lilii]